MRLEKEWWTGEDYIFLESRHQNGACDNIILILRRKQYADTTGEQRGETQQ